MFGTGRGQVDHEADLRRELLQAPPAPVAEEGVDPLPHEIQHEVVEHPLQERDGPADRFALGDRRAADVAGRADEGAVLPPLARAKSAGPIWRTPVILMQPGTLECS